jgi:hypothetical protein
MFEHWIRWSLGLGSEHLHCGRSFSDVLKSSQQNAGFAPATQKAQSQKNDRNISFDRAFLCDSVAIS